MVLEHEFEDRLSYVRDVDEGRTLVVRLIRSSWSHDSLNFRTRCSSTNWRDIPNRCIPTSDT
ncbi:BZ3500_MvSof-1268-A1-R1_Chr4-1g06658 [Microbotryum saponariae]|uniref:BZ3500_MvSof-1268-A1-R1_Chr4-1g06658 protein n=1 Tax=Microbotryum saponariae TaxID=289078 RepID=A0A2X0MWT4_9BASI|nr:BZ3500_MvSof-1268-A1-R1_Chr4-1g06658 [Microbotryum saponariae]SDA06323.1 BZ3501_MvSof-1269-A2-R1_Chr4-1g06368 [Microbotryum saponariae]